jgi:hypothetical protein
MFKRNQTRGDNHNRKAENKSKDKTRPICDLENSGGETTGNESESFWMPEIPPDMRKIMLEDIMAFESVATGTSLFDGLRQHGLDLPHPETLNESQSLSKVHDIVVALADLQVFLVGYDNMSPQKLYRTLWSQTLWEGCYVRKRTPGAITLLDVSHKMSRSELKKYLEPMPQSVTLQ